MIKYFCVREEEDTTGAITQWERWRNIRERGIVSICDKYIQGFVTNAFSARAADGGEKYGSHSETSLRVSCLCNLSTGVLCLYKHWVPPIQDLNVEFIKICDMNNVKLTLNDTCLYMISTITFLICAWAIYWTCILWIESIYARC